MNRFYSQTQLPHWDDLPGQTGKEGWDSFQWPQVLLPEVAFITQHVSLGYTRVDGAPTQQTRRIDATTLEEALRGVAQVGHRKFLADSIFLGDDNPRMSQYKDDDLYYYAYEAISEYVKALAANEE